MCRGVDVLTLQTGQVVALPVRLLSNCREIGTYASIGQASFSLEGGRGF